MCVDNQDQIARQLIRIDIVDMHNIIYNYGMSGRNNVLPWKRILYGGECIALLNMHGWELDEYAAAERSLGARGASHDSLTFHFRLRS